MKIKDLLREDDTQTELTPSQESRAVATMKDLIDSDNARNASDAAYTFLDNIAGFELNKQALNKQASRLVVLYKKKYGKQS